MEPTERPDPPDPDAGHGPAPDPDRTPYVRPAEPDAGVRETVARVLAELTRAGETRRAVARVDDGQELIEVSAAAGDRWSARSSLVEWSYGPDGLASWHVSLAGARARRTTERRGWVHPAVGLLRPELLPVWGRPGDRFRPVHVTEGIQGPALLDLAPVGGEVVDGQPVGRGGSLYLDLARGLVTCLDLGDRCWTLVDYRDL